MDEQGSPIGETLDQTPAGRPQAGWGLWALSVLALAAVGALSYCVAAAAPYAVVTLPPVAMILFGVLAGVVQGYLWRRPYPPARWWVLASSLAGFVAAGVSVLSTALTESAPSLLSGWAYAWAAYGAVYGLMLQRIAPRRGLILASLAGWAAAGMASGAVGWALDVFQVTETVPTEAFFDLPSRTWSLAGLGLVGAVCGATGGAITGAALVVSSRRPPARVPQDDGVRQAKDRRLVIVAGIISGLVAAMVCTYTAPLIFTMLTEGSLDSLDLTIFFMSAIYGTPVCVPTIALVAIPSAIGCGYAGLGLARARGRRDARPWIWCGALIGGVAGYLLAFLLVLAIGDWGG